MVEATKKMFSNYANFKDRTSRRDFWLAILGYFLLSFCVGIIAGILSGITGNENMTKICTTIWEIATIIPSISMEVRRLHDVNKSGWWLFISAVPVVGQILLLVWYCSASVNENNNY